MAAFFKRDYPTCILILIISVIYWLGIAAVPFHPDESTQLYMSGDLKTLFTKPADLFWRPAETPDLRQYYREVDPPLTKYIIGIGLAISGENPLDQDWDWAKSWSENNRAGAVPSEKQLITARLSVALLFPFSLLLAYLIGKNLRSRTFGWINMGLLAVNALVLIHTRRAMTESALLFGVLFCLWAAVSWKRGRYWLAIPAAIAFNAKYTALPFVLIGLIAVLWDFKPEKTVIKNRVLHSILYSAIFLILTFALNPFLWKTPVAALRDAVDSRQELVYRQSQVFNMVDSSMVLDTFGEKTNALLAQLFFSPPAAADVGNYSEELSIELKNYSSNPLHNFFRGWIGGSIILFLTTVGFALWIVGFFRTKPPSRAEILILSSFVLQLTAILAMLLFPFQRYYVPLVPFITLMLALALIYPFGLFNKKKSPKPSGDFKD